MFLVVKSSIFISNNLFRTLLIIFFSCSPLSRMPEGASSGRLRRAQQSPGSSIERASNGHAVLISRINVHPNLLVVQRPSWNVLAYILQYIK